MQISALKHFLITGIVFAILPAMFVNIFLGIIMGVIEHIFGFDSSRWYISSLLVTAFFIAVISLCMAIGNKYFARGREHGLERQTIVQSTFLFAICILAFIAYDFLSTHEIEMAWAYEHPLEVFMMISLPIMEILALSSLYFIFAMRQLHREAV